MGKDKDDFEENDELSYVGDSYDYDIEDDEQEDDSDKMNLEELPEEELQEKEQESEESQEDASLDLDEDIQEDSYTEEHLQMQKEEIEQEFKPADIQASDENQEELEAMLRQTMSELLAEDYESNREIVRGKKKKRTRVILMAVSIVVVLLLIAMYFIFTKQGRKQVIDVGADYIYDHLDTQDSKNHNEDQAVVRTKETEDGVDEVYNIALIGVQECNSDTMIIATLNVTKHTLSLTSLMRDIYVDIPGFISAKLNAAYALGGIDTFYDTLESTFDIKLDGYILVDYDVFEFIIDEIGGVEVDLTETEAKYLNHTNYISKKQYRNVHTGEQTLNGNQALGYCRVRYRATRNNEVDDFGRTARQRYVLSQVLQKVKSKSLFSLVQIADHVLSETSIKTDISRPLFKKLANEVLEVDLNHLTNYRIPEDGTYTNGTRSIYKKNQQVLLLSDIEATKMRLKEITQQDQRNEAKNEEILDDSENADVVDEFNQLD